MKDIFLIRHGRQCSKRCNVDVELDAVGRYQAELAGRRLQTYGLQKLYASELLRAKETAKIIGTYLEMDYEVLPAIQEIDFGELTGRTNKEIHKLYEDFWRERSRHREDLAYPGGGECGADVAERVMPQLFKLCGRPEERIAVVTHGGVIRSVCAQILGTGQKNKLKFGIDMENTSLTHLIYDEDRAFFFLERFNDFAHLEGHPELLRGNWKTSLERKR